jgi:hypothetical protein
MALLALAVPCLAVADKSFALVMKLASLRDKEKDEFEKQRKEFGTS